MALSKGFGGAFAGLGPKPPRSLFIAAMIITQEPMPYKIADRVGAATGAMRWNGDWDWDGDGGDAREGRSVGGVAGEASAVS